MTEKNKPSTTNTQPAEDEKEVENATEKANDLPLADGRLDLNTLTGRDFKSLDEFGKHYKNLVSRVGDQEVAELRRKAELFDALPKKSEEVKVEVKSDDNTEAKEKPSNEIEMLRQEIALQKSYPNADKYLKEVKSIAETTGENFKETYERVFVPLVKADEALTDEENKKLTKTVESNSRVVVSGDLPEAIKTAQKTGDWKEVLKLKKIV